MKNTNYLLAATTIALSSFLSGQAFAAAPAEPAKMEMAHSPSLTDGEVKKIDKEQGKITLKHGAIKHMDMPGMTMVFLAQDKAMLDTVKVGDKVRFRVVEQGGKMTVTEIGPAN
ncbi:MAG: copper-binding protein [Rhodoferax sp.]|jgi:Cu/Ag efflux protein CusF|nr:copper-binding protein [Rhodoferax sp.]